LSEPAQGLSNVFLRLDIRADADECLRHHRQGRFRISSTPTLWANRRAVGFSTVTCTC
jgi:hypothetical protein